jgi:beta-lactamase class A
MTNADLEQSIAEITRLPAGRVGVSAETIDGRHRIEVNADEIFPTASSIKMYVLYTLLVKAEDGQLALNERLETTAAAAKPGSGVLFHLDPGLQPTLKDLATLMMMISDNSALMVLTEYLGVDSINAEIDRLGLKHTRFGDWTRFENDYADSMMFGQATPREFVQFLLRMRTGNLLSPASQEIFWDTLRIQKYIEPMRKLLPASPWAREFGYPETVWVASKSGLLDDCASESGFIKVHYGGWAISIMIKDFPEIGLNPAVGENLISTISLRIYETWAPFFEGEQSTSSMAGNAP